MESLLSVCLLGVHMCCWELMTDAGGQLREASSPLVQVDPGEGNSGGQGRQQRSRPSDSPPQSSHFLNVDEWIYNGGQEVVVQSSCG